MVELVLDCADLEVATAFWTAALGYEKFGAAKQYVSLVPRDGTGPKLILQRVDEPKTVKNRMHLDIKADDIEAEATRLVAFGARRLQQEHVVEFGERWILLADPEGNELCVCQC